MTVHQCPKCELRFTWKTELDDHCATGSSAVQARVPGAQACTGRADTTGRVADASGTVWLGHSLAPDG